MRWGRPPVPGVPAMRALARVFIQIQRQRGKAVTTVVWRHKVEVRGEGAGTRTRTRTRRLEGGVHSSVQLYNLKRFVPLQFGANQVLPQLQKHSLLQAGLVGDKEMGKIHIRQ